MAAYYFYYDDETIHEMFQVEANTPDQASEKAQAKCVENKWYFKYCYPL